MERTTDLYKEMQVCEAFGKWPHEFWALDEEEQFLCKRYLLLKNGKEYFASLFDEKDKFRFFLLWWGIEKK